MPFPAPYPLLLVPDPVLATALAGAVVETTVARPAVTGPGRLAISLVAIDEPPGGPRTFRHGGVREREMHYSASLLKVAAMFAAFGLRQSANRFGTTAGDCASGVLFPQMDAAFRPAVTAAASLIPNKVMPRYGELFDAQGLGGAGGCLVSLRPDVVADLEQMIGHSDPAASGRIITKLGFAWITGLCTRTGLFDAAGQHGIWLAGTFTGAIPPVRVPSLNDGPSAQATTCVDMARLMALLVDGAAVDAHGPDSISAEMLDMMAGGGSWLTGGGLHTDFTVTHAKVGTGPLGAGPVEVASEAVIVRHEPTQRRFVVVWQNVLNDVDEIGAVTFLVERALRHALGIP